MIEAEEALGREPSVATLRAAHMLVDQALAHGYDPVRGQLYEAGSAYGRPVDRSIGVGPVRGLPCLPADGRAVRPRGRRCRDAFAKAWALARDAFADPQYPGVCPLMDERGEVHCESKSHQWFVSYHTARALLLTADRLRKPKMPGCASYFGVGPSRDKKQIDTSTPPPQAPTPPRARRPGSRREVPVGGLHQEEEGLPLGRRARAIEVRCPADPLDEAVPVDLRVRGGPNAVGGRQVRRRQPPALTPR